MIKYFIVEKVLGEFSPWIIPSSQSPLIKFPPGESPRLIPPHQEGILLGELAGENSPGGVLHIPFEKNMI